MKPNVKNLFSLSITDTEYFKDMKEKFELVSCPIHERHCEKLRSNLNKSYFDSEQYHISKEYQKSVELLKSAYVRTFELTHPVCANCADFFRSTIEESLINIENEQRKMPRGLFSIIKRQRVNSVALESVLKEV